MNKSLLGFILLTSPIIASAAGFGLVEQSGSGMGNAFAGGAAIAEDASTVYSNPAGMVYIQGSQLVGAVHLINPNISFNNEGSVSGQFRPLGNEGGNYRCIISICFSISHRDCTSVTTKSIIIDFQLLGAC